MILTTSTLALDKGHLNIRGQELQERATKELAQLLTRAEAWGKVKGGGWYERPGGRSGSLEVCKMTASLQE